MASSGAAVMPWLLRGGFFIAVVGGSYWLLRNIILTIRRNRDLSKLGTNTPEGIALGFASRCYAALIPTGHPWVNDTVGDGTELEDLFQIAREIHRAGPAVDFGLVSSKYRSLYDRDLLRDISNDLSKSDVSKFNGLLSSGLGAPVELTAVLTHHLVTTRETTSYDDKLTALQEVPARTRLGFHAETMITAAGDYHGFEYLGNMRFVPANAVVFTSAN
jgi:hypothetical protein